VSQPDDGWRQRLTNGGLAQFIPELEAYGINSVSDIMEEMLDGKDGEIGGGKSALELMQVRMGKGETS
jgi:hypothetical protein